MAPRHRQSSKLAKMRTSLYLLALINLGAVTTSWSFNPTYPTAFKVVPRFATLRKTHTYLPSRKLLQTSGLSMSKVSDGVSSTLESMDRVLLKRFLRIVNHLPAIGSLAYFGVISSQQMMGGPSPLLPLGEPTLVSALSKYVGPTSAAGFSAMFPTAVTPAKWVFFIWPIISILQVVTLAASVLKPRSPLLSQNDLACLSSANVAATSWLIFSSRATANMPPPLGCALVLPLVPILAGYALRNPAHYISNRPKFGKLALQVFSAFTTIASFLALTVELQYGGSIPFFLGRSELCAGVFLGLSALAVTTPRQGIVRKLVTAGALSGILSKRVTDNLAAFGRYGVRKLAMSPSFWGTAVVFLWALGRVFDTKDMYGDNL